MLKQFLSSLNTIHLFCLKYLANMVLYAFFHKEIKALSLKNELKLDLWNLILAIISGNF